MFLILVAGCSSVSQQELRLKKNMDLQSRATLQVDVAAYSKPFGEAPENPDLREVFLSLPSELVADMPAKVRPLFLSNNASNSDMLDPANGYLTYFSDNPYDSTRATSIFTIKLLPSEQYGYIVFIHMSKPPALGTRPNPGNTFILAPRNGQWIDVTPQLLPPGIGRDWYFDPKQGANTVETGPYALHQYGWTEGEKKFDLIWQDDRFVPEVAR